MKTKSVWFLIMMILLPGCAARPPQHLGVRDGKLAPCPDSPNCVTSQSDDAKHNIQPLTYSTSVDSAHRELAKLIESMPRTKVIAENENYIHAEFTIAVMGFVDDVEFYFDDANKTIHVRSASRVGYWDWGVNRRRVEKIRMLWEGSATAE